MYFANCTPTLKPAMTASLAIEHTSLCNNSDLCTLAMLRVPGPGVEGCSSLRDFQKESLWRCFLHLQGYGHCCTVYVGMTVSDVLVVDFIGHWISLFIFFCLLCYCYSTTKYSVYLISFGGIFLVAISNPEVRFTASHWTADGLPLSLLQLCLLRV